MEYDDLNKRGWIPPGMAAAIQEALRHGLRNDGSKADMRHAMSVALLLLDGGPFDPLSSPHMGAPQPGRVTVELDDGSSLTCRSDDLLVTAITETSEDDKDLSLWKIKPASTTNAIISVLGVCARDDDGFLYRVNAPQD